MATIYTDTQGRQVYDFNGKVVDAKTGQPVGNALPTVPNQTGGTNVTKPTSSTPILDYADTLDKAVSLARQKRSSLGLEFMAPYKGKALASDFSGILGKLNNASDSFAERVLERATKTDELLSVSEAEALGLPYGTTQKEAAGRGIIPKPTSATAPTSKPQNSGGLLYTDADIGEGVTALHNAKGSDGYVYTPTYVDMYTAWVAGGGLPQDFIKLFPPDTYLNPNDPSVPSYLKPKSSGSSIDLSGFNINDID